MKQARLINNVRMGQTINAKDSLLLRNNDNRPILMVVNRLKTAERLNLSGFRFGRYRGCVVPCVRKP